MSIHAQLSEEALAALEAQKRKSTISSIVISVLSIVLVGLVLGLVLLDEFIRETPTIVTYAATLNEDQQVDQRKVTTQLQRKPSSPSSAQAKVIAAQTASPTAVPVPEVEVVTPSTEFGDSNDFGTGWGDGTGSGGGFGGIPQSMRRRCSPEDRLARLRETGGTPECEVAVEKGLEWLMRTQNTDGSWTNDGYRAGYTGLGLLAYLGRCETPMSDKYGESCLRAITYLIDLGMKNNGRLSFNPANNHWPYCHSIAAYALAEAYTFCKQLDIHVPNLAEVVQQSGQFIIDNQHTGGGWDYSYAQTSGRGGDTSIVAWHLQALKALQYTGLEFQGLVSSANNGVRYMESKQNRNGGFGYSSPNNPVGGVGYFTMTGGGLLSVQLWGRGNQSSARQAARYIEQNTAFDFNGPTSDLYGHYYEAQAMLNRGGEQWRKYNEMFRPQLLDNQNEDGSWKAPNQGQTAGIRAVGARFVTNVHYRTTLCILMLETYYRFLPGTGGAR